VEHPSGLFTVAVCVMSNFSKSRFRFNKIEQLVETFKFNFFQLNIILTKKSFLNIVINTILLGCHNMAKLTYVAGFKVEILVFFRKGF